MFKTMEWLPQPPDDFRKRVQSLHAAIGEGVDQNVQDRLIDLATAALDDVQLGKIAGLVRDSDALDASFAGMMRIRLGIVGDGTLSLIADPIVGSGVRHGLRLTVVEGEYGSAVQEAMDPSSHLHAADLDFLLVALDSRLLGLDTAADSVNEATNRVDAAFGKLRMIAEGLRSAVKSSILVQTLPAPMDPLFGSFDRVTSGSPFAMVGALNRRIVDWASEGGIVLVDIARLAATVGLEEWHDPALWNAAKLPFAPAFIPAYADVVARTIAAVRGRSRKCLVLDLDNTLWGGVIGDDGLSGIKLGQGSALGEAFLAVQRLALELRARGVVLAVCSKNEDEAARLPFREHPDMLLREEHIAVFQANWTDKATNLKAIAETLNIGIDALVFLDDNPAERLQVRSALPLVAVPELPEDPALYPRTLTAAGYFEAVAFSKEDRERAEMYRANAQRAQALSASGDLNAYLQSLDMVCTISHVDAVSRPRVSQLINKSNQFNLTTRRYSEPEIEAAENDPSRHAIQIRLTDRFGDNGIISVIIADKGVDAWSIDTWLMSCRVLGRRVQEAALAHLVAAARSEGAAALLGRYIPSAKNRMVADHYTTLGFNTVKTTPNQETLYRLEFSDYVDTDFPMKIDDTALNTNA